MAFNKKLIDPKTIHLHITEFIYVTTYHVQSVLQFKSCTNNNQQFIMIYVLI